MAISVDDDGWHDIDRELKIQFDEESHDIKVKEKNSSSGVFGRACILNKFPAILLHQGIIGVEEKIEMEHLIEDSEPVIKRKAETIMPDYMRIRK